MIAVDFDYCQPNTLEELRQAIEANAQRAFVLYGGGSEIISMARTGSIEPQAVIDLKAIAQMRIMEKKNGRIVLGAALTLTQIAQADWYPLLSKTVRRIADHTNQCRITLGGNVCGTIFYREAVLPLLLADADVTLWRGGIQRTVSLLDVFNGRLQRKPDEAVLDFSFDAKYASLPYVHVKKTRGDKIDYPLVTICAMRTPDGIRMAFSGVCEGPFRNGKIEQILNDLSQSPARRAEAAAQNLPAPILNDLLGKPDWRLFQLKQTICNAIEQLEGEYRAH